MRLFPLLLSLVAMLISGCTNTSESNKSHNIRIVELQHSEIWSKGKLDLIPTVYAENFIGHFPAGTVRGQAGVRERVLAHRTAFPDWTEIEDDVIADRDRVVTRFTSSGTNLGDFLGNPATGKHVEISEVCIYRLVEGKIAEMWVYPDFQSMQRQLGVQRTRQ